MPGRGTEAANSRQVRQEHRDELFTSLCAPGSLGEVPMLEHFFPRRKPQEVLPHKASCLGAPAVGSEASRKMNYLRKIN